MSFNDHPLFDDDAGEQAKEEGMEAAANSRQELLETARGVARNLALLSPNRETNIDEVGVKLYEVLKIKSLGPAAGSVFKGEEWQFTGKRIKSKRKKNHAREIKIWRLK